MARIAHQSNYNFPHKLLAYKRGCNSNANKQRKVPNTFSVDAQESSERLKMNVGVMEAIVACLNIAIHTLFLFMLA